MISIPPLSTSYKILKEGFSWEKIPNFTVITGLNGSGKTQILNYLSENPGLSNIGQGDIVYKRSDGSTQLKRFQIKNLILPHKRIKQAKLCFFG
jgi:ABC-type transport system involved in cytochrome c biogenesis ATPase subunit